MIQEKGLCFLLKIIPFFYLVFCLGCVSGSLNTVQFVKELPSELPKDLKDRFEIRENGTVVQPVAIPQKEKSRRSRKGKKQNLAKVVDFVPAPVLVSPVRRASKDPVWMGEKFVYSISYFGVSAGDFSMEVLPFKVMNNRKVYHVFGHAVSSSVFSLFYRLDDTVESYIDYDGIFSHRFHIVLDETKQTRDSLELNDFEKRQTYYWNRWNRKSAGYVETKEFAVIEPFSQDSLSSVFYLRHVPLPPDAVVSFPVVSEGKSIEVICTVLRREMRDTPMGEVQTIVLKVETKFQGILKKTGDSFVWLTDDERRIPVHMEAKVKIGTVVSNLKKVELGHPSN